MKHVLVLLTLAMSGSAFANDCTYSKIIEKDYWEKTHQESTSTDYSDLMKGLAAKGITFDKNSPNIIKSTVNITGRKGLSVLKPYNLLNQISCPGDRAGDFAYEQSVTLQNGEEVIAELGKEFTVSHGCGFRDFSTEDETELVVISQNCR